jgi:hypothetical protein
MYWTHGLVNKIPINNLEINESEFFRFSSLKYKFKSECETQYNPEILIYYLNTFYIILNRNRWFKFKTKSLVMTINSKSFSDFVIRKICDLLLKTMINFLTLTLFQISENPEFFFTFHVFGLL